MLKTLEKKRQWTLKQFNWRAFVVRILVNALTLVLTVFVTPAMDFVEPTILKIIFLAMMLGVLNALIKPIIQFFTLSYIFVTYGLVVIFINGLLLYILHWLFPSMLQIDNLLWVLWGGAVMGIVSGILESVFGLTLPIVDESAVTERMRQEEERQRRRMAAFQEQVVDAPPEVANAASSLDVGSTPEIVDLPPEEEAGAVSALVAAPDAEDARPSETPPPATPENDALDPDIKATGGDA